MDGLRPMPFSVVTYKDIHGNPNIINLKNLEIPSYCKVERMFIRSSGIFRKKYEIIVIRTYDREVLKLSNLDYEVAAKLLDRISRFFFDDDDKEAE